MNNNTIIFGLIGVVAVGALVLFATMGGNNNNQTDQTQTQTDTEQVVMEQQMMEEESMDEPTTEMQSIVDIAAGNPDFSILVTAVTEAGLVDTLSTGGPYTVFAPTNAAFEALGQQTIDAVLADKEQLTNILTYHVVEGKVMAQDVLGLTSATALNGGTLNVTVEDAKKVMINDATVVTTDIEASNGVIHVIDTVLMPQ